MVTWTIGQYKADPKKVFVTGSSSGAMMTVRPVPFLTAYEQHTLMEPTQNVMAATYPEMFQAGIVYSGTAAGCFYSQSGGVDAWNNSCANGQARGTPQVWAKVRTRRNTSLPVTCTSSLANK